MDIDKLIHVFEEFLEEYRFSSLMDIDKLILDCVATRRDQSFSSLMDIDKLIHRRLHPVRAIVLVH